MKHVLNNLHHVRSAWNMSWASCWTYMMKVIPDMPHAERTWWRLVQTCLMLNVHDEGYSRHASCCTYMMKIIPDMPHAERTWWRLVQTCVMLNVHVEGYFRHASCWTYMMKVIQDMPHAERTWCMRHVWNNLHHVHSAWGMSGITFMMYVQHEACLE
jgi:hypothetical protein